MAQVIPESSTKALDELVNLCDRRLLPVIAVSATSQTAIPTTTRQITLGVANIILVPMDAVDYYMEKGVITDYTDEMPELFWHLNMVTY